MKKHTMCIIPGKSKFYHTVDTNKAVLDAAAYADKHNLWSGTNLSKAKVPVLGNNHIGVTGVGTPTKFINVYRTSNGFVHGTPGN